jgi:hypothetical protein
MHTGILCKTTCPISAIRTILWGELRLSPSELKPKMGALYQPRIIDERVRHWWYKNWHGQSKVHKEKSAKVPCFGSTRGSQSSTIFMKLALNLIITWYVQNINVGLIFWSRNLSELYCHVIYAWVTNNDVLWIGWLDLLVPSFTISLNYNKLKELTIFCRTLLPRLQRTRSTLVLVLRLTSDLQVDYLYSLGADPSRRKHIHYCWEVFSVLRSNEHKRDHRKHRSCIVGRMFVVTCLPSRYIPMGLCVTIFWNFSSCLTENPLPLSYKTRRLMLLKKHSTFLPRIVWNP